MIYRFLLFIMITQVNVVIQGMHRETEDMVIRDQAQHLQPCFQGAHQKELKLKLETMKYEQEYGRLKYAQEAARLKYEKEYANLKYEKEYVNTIFPLFLNQYPQQNKSAKTTKMSPEEYRSQLSRMLFLNNHNINQDDILGIMNTMYEEKIDLTYTDSWGRNIVELCEWNSSTISPKITTAIKQWFENHNITLIPKQPKQYNHIQRCITDKVQGESLTNRLPIRCASSPAVFHTCNKTAPLTNSPSFIKPLLHKPRPTTPLPLKLTKLRINTTPTKSTTKNTPESTSRSIFCQKLPQKKPHTFSQRIMHKIQSHRWPTITACNCLKRNKKVVNG